MARYRALFVCILLVAAPLGPARAAQWVVGSFNDEAYARTEARRLEAALGVAVSVSATAPHRLLIDAGELPAEADRAWFAAAGVPDAWRLAVSTPASPARAEPAAEATEGDAVWLLVARVDDVQDSIDIELALTRAFSGVSTWSFIDNGDLVHSVYLGPIRPADVSAVQARLIDLGFSSASRAAAPPEPKSGRFVEITASQSESSLAGQPDDSPPVSQESSEAESDFNFATLRRRESE